MYNNAKSDLKTYHELVKRQRSVGPMYAIQQNNHMQIRTTYEHIHQLVFMVVWVGGLL